MVDAESLAVRASPHELGGILVGWWEDHSKVVVQDLLPVPDQGAGRDHYERRHSPAQRVLDDYVLTNADPKCGYVGEWHSHPAPLPPSSIDRAVLRAIVRQVNHPVALVVLALGSDDVVTVHGLVGCRGWLGRATTKRVRVERMA